MQPFCLLFEEFEKRICSLSYPPFTLRAENISSPLDSLILLYFFSFCILALWQSGFWSLSLKNSFAVPISHFSFRDRWGRALWRCENMKLSSFFHSIISQFTPNNHFAVIVKATRHWAKSSLLISLDPLTLWGSHNSWSTLTGKEHTFV